MVQPKIREITHQVEAFGGGDVPMPPLVYFGEDPRLHQRAAGDHNGVNAMKLTMFFAILPAENVSTSNKWSLPVHSLRAFVDVAPIRSLRGQKGKRL